MSIQAVPSMSTIPPFPALADRSDGTYNLKAYTFGTYMSVTFNGELLAVAGSAYNNAVAAAASATAAATSATAAASIQLTGTSTSSVLVFATSRSFVTQAGKAFQANTPIIAVRAADPTVYMYGTVASYSGTSLVINVLEANGTGTYSDWNISVCGTRGPQGSSANIGTTYCTGNGFGTTDTKIRRFTTVLEFTGASGSYILSNDSAANGTTFTVQESGLYNIHYSEPTAAAVTFGVSVSSSQLTTGVASITVNYRAAICGSGSGGGVPSVSRTMWLNSGSIVRAHWDSGTAIDGDNRAFFSIRKVGT